MSTTGLDVDEFFFFFFQAEDGIRDHCVTGVQTCALPISLSLLRDFPRPSHLERPLLSQVACGPRFCGKGWPRGEPGEDAGVHCGCGIVREIGRASCRERV